MDSRNTLVINLDDLLYDLYKIRQSHWLTLAKEEDLPYSETFFMVSHEANSDKLEKIGREYPKLEPYFKRIDELVKAQIEASLPNLRPNPEKSTLITELSRDHRIILVSNLNRSQLASLKSLNELDFDIAGLYSIKDVMSAKPDPDIYLKIARALGVLPNKLIVVEAGINGILAAYLANAKAVYIQEFMAPSQAIMEFSTIYLEHLDQLKTTLEAWSINRNG